MQLSPLPAYGSAGPSSAAGSSQQVPSDLSQLAGQLPSQLGPGSSLNSSQQQAAQARPSLLPVCKHTGPALLCCTPSPADTRAGIACVQVLVHHCFAADQLLLTQQRVIINHPGLSHTGLSAAQLTALLLAAQAPPGSRLYVTVSKSVGEALLHSIFASLPGLLACDLKRDSRTGQSRVRT